MVETSRVKKHGKGSSTDKSNRSITIWNAGYSRPRYRKKNGIGLESSLFLESFTTYLFVVLFLFLCPLFP